MLLILEDLSGLGGGTWDGSSRGEEWQRLFFARDHAIGQVVCVLSILSDLVSPGLRDTTCQVSSFTNHLVISEAQWPSQG